MVKCVCLFTEQLADESAPVKKPVINNNVNKWEGEDEDDVKVCLWFVMCMRWTLTFYFARILIIFDAQFIRGYVCESRACFNYLWDFKWFSLFVTFIWPTFKCRSKSNLERCTAIRVAVFFVWETLFTRILSISNYRIAGKMMMRRQRRRRKQKKWKHKWWRKPNHRRI